MEFEGKTCTNATYLTLQKKLQSINSELKQALQNVVTKSKVVKMNTTSK